MKIRVILCGRNYDAASHLPAELTLPEGAALEAALQAVAAALPGDRQLPGSCLVALSGVHLGTLRSHRARNLRDGDELILLAPVAGG